MPADKAQLDTLRMYFSNIAPAEKVEELLSKAKELPVSKAQEIIVLFEQRRRVQLKDVQKLLR